MSVSIYLGAAHQQRKMTKHIAPLGTILLIAANLIAQPSAVTGFSPIFRNCLTSRYDHRVATSRVQPLHADMTIQRGCQFYSINYNYIERPDSILPPVVVLHGGPGIPSNYLRPLEDLITDRSILFWDQLGCGKSDQPDDESLYSIDLYIDDLVQLLDEVDMADFHLYGQSFGGILAYEYLKREQPENCLSVVLSSSPTDVAQVEEVAEGLVQRLAEEGVGGEDLGEEFRKRHQVQTETQPLPLREAYAMAGTTFRGTTAISDYKASLGDDDTPLETPVLVMRGQKDFVTSACVKDWQDLFHSAEIKELGSCAHHGMLEKPDVYTSCLSEFWSKFDQC